MQHLVPVLVLLAVVAVIATAVGVSIEEGDMLLPPGEFAINVAEHHAALEDLCPRLQTLIAPVLSIKRHEEHEADLIAHAIGVATMMQDMHNEFKTSHHREWSCDQVAAAVEQKRYKKFCYEMDRWFLAEAFDDHAVDLGGVRHPPHTLADMVEEFQSMAVRVGLVDDADRSQIEPFYDCAEDVRFLVKWYEHVMEARRKLKRALKASDRDDLTCVTEFDDLANAVHGIVEGFDSRPHHHLATVPQWHAVYGHVSHLESICSHVFPPGPPSEDGPEDADDSPPPPHHHGGDVHGEEESIRSRKTDADSPPSRHVHPGEPRRTIPHDHDPSVIPADHEHTDPAPEAVEVEDM